LDVYEVTSHSPIKLTLLENQIIDYEVEVRNAGTVPICSLNVFFVPKLNCNSFDFLRNGGKSGVLPIMPGEKRTIMLHIMAKMHGAINEVHITYSSSTPEEAGTDSEAYSRDFLLPISTTVLDSVALTRVKASLLSEDEHKCRVSFLLKNNSTKSLVINCSVDDSIMASREGNNDIIVKDNVTLKPSESGTIVIERDRMVPQEEELQTVAFFPDSYRNGHFVNPEDLVSEHNVNRPESLPVRLRKNAIAEFFNHVHLTWKTLSGDREGLLLFDQQDLLTSDIVRPMYVSPITLVLQDDLADTMKDSVGRSILQPLRPLKLLAKATSVFSQHIVDPLRIEFSVATIPSDQNKHDCYAMHGCPTRTFEGLPAHKSLEHSISLVALPNSTPGTTIHVSVSLVAVWGKVFTISKEYSLQAL